MANTNTQPPNDPRPLDRENDEAIAQSTRQHWSVLRHLLGLPSLLDLENFDQEQVAQRIANHIDHVRGGIANVDVLRDLLHEQFQQEEQISQRSFPEGSIVHHRQESGLAAADAWLKVILQHFTEADVRALIEQLPASILTTNIVDGHVWMAINVDMGVLPLRMIEIDLRHPIWRSGDVETIRQRLSGLSATQAGIDVFPEHPPITDITSAINAIFDSAMEVVDPNLALYPIDLQGIPAGGNLTFDLPGLIRSHPETAAMNVQQLRAFFAAHQDIVDQHVIAINDPAHAGVAMDTVARVIFTQLRRPYTQPLASVQSSLADAIEARQPIERLLAGSADNRELMLALSIIQRDPQARHALDTEEEEEIEQNTRRRTVASILHELSESQPIVLPAPLPPNASLADIDNSLLGLQTDIHTLQLELNNWNVQENAHRTALNAHQNALNSHQALQQNIAAATARNQARDQRHQANVNAYMSLPVATRATIPPPVADPHEPVPVLTPLPVTPPAPAFTPIAGLISPFGGVIHTAEELKTRLNDYRRIERDLMFAISQLEERGHLLEQMCTALNELEINIAETYPTLTILVDLTGPHFERDQVRANTRWGALALEIRNNTPEGLQTVEHYNEEIRRLRAEVEEQHEEEHGPHGSEACWNVIRRGLQNQGMRGKELETNIGYMQSKLQRNDEAVRDMEALAESEFPYEGTEEAQEHWEEGKSSGRLLWRYDAWHEYSERLYDALGIHPEDLEDEDSHHPRQRRFRLPQLTNAYFATKYLSSLPESDPRCLPHIPEIINYQRGLHSAIIDRAQESYNNALGGSEQLRAMGIEPNMTIGQRVQAAQNYLRNDCAYLDRYRPLFDQISNEAIRPVRERIDRSQQWVQRNAAVRGTAAKGAVWLGLSPFRLTKYVFYTKPKAVLKKHGRAMLIGAGIGTALTPGFLPGVGTVLGALIAPVAYGTYKYLAKPSGDAPATHAHQP